MSSRSIVFAAAILILVASVRCGKPQRPAEEGEKANPERGDVVEDTASTDGAPDTTAPGRAPLPADFPGDVPIVPGGAIVESRSRPDAEGRLSEMTLTTPHAPGDVLAWYRRMLPGAGWIIVGETTLPSGYVLSAAQGPSSLEVTVESDADSANLEGARVRTVVWKVDP